MAESETWLSVFGSISKNVNSMKKPRAIEIKKKN